MPKVRWIALMKTGLGDQHRPPGVTPAHCAQDLEDRILAQVRRLHDPQHQVRLGLAEANVLGRVIGDFPQSAGVQEAHHRGLGREVVEAGGAGAGPESVADLSAWAVGQGANDGGLAGLGFAQQPHHRHWLARTGATQGGLQGLVIDRWVQ